MLPSEKKIAASSSPWSFKTRLSVASRKQTQHGGSEVSTFRRAGGSNEISAWPAGRAAAARGGVRLYGIYVTGALRGRARSRVIAL